MRGFHLDKLICTILLILSLVDISVTLNIRQVVEQGLYSTNDNVIVLTIDNFKKEIYGRDQAWFVKFYSSWCGYCQRFAPVWKTLASDVKQWQDVATIGVMDCSNEANEPICTQFEITKYPTLKYFHEKYVEGVHNLGLPVPLGLDPNEDRKNLIALLIKDQADGKGTVLPNLQPYNYSDIFNIFETSTRIPKYAFLIIQDPSDFVGAEVTMDFHDISDVIVRYSYNNNTQLLESLKINSKFALLVMERDGNASTILTTTSSDRIALKDSIRQFLVLKNVDLYKIDKPNSNNVKTTLKELIPDIKFGDTVFLGDLESALRYSLKREVGRVKEITGEQLESVKNYVNLLIKYFPLGINAKALLLQIKDYLASDNAISGMQVWKMMKDVEQSGQQVFTSPQQWIACQGSAPQYRGYPCGLWTMFHYLTVNVAFENANTNSYSNEVLKAMHSYIKNFFGCEDCSNHFQQMASRRGIFSTVSHDDSILWLWRAHNEVNQRLAGDQTEDPQHPKIQFPSKNNCPQCYYGDNTWNEVEVLRYLKQIYSRKNIYIGPHANALLENTVTNASGTVFSTNTNLLLAASVFVILKKFYLFY